jgi:hypothetical protein
MDRCTLWVYVHNRGRCVICIYTHTLIFGVKPMYVGRTHLTCIGPIPNVNVCTKCVPKSMYKYHLPKQGTTCDENKIEVRKNKVVKTQETKMYLTLKSV